MMKRSLFKSLILVVFTLSLGSCKSGGGSSATSAPPAPASTPALSCSSNPGGTVSSVAVGTLHSCAVVDGAVKCWGNNDQGQLGDGTTISRKYPVQVSGITSGAIKISLSSGDLGFTPYASSSCAIVNGAAKCWGSNLNGKLGIGSSIDQSLPSQVSGLASGVTDISMGRFHACAVVTSLGQSSIKCWGNNGTYALGNAGVAQESNVPVDSGVMANADKVATGANHTCAVASGRIFCWGYNSFGQFADGGVVANSSSPVTSSGLLIDAVSVSGAWSHSCALVNGTAKCWGFNFMGQIGNGTSADALTPATVLAGGVTAVAAGVYHTCAIQNGAVYCWGANMMGQLGNGTLTDSNVPVQVSGISSGATSIAVGVAHSCAVVNGKVLCWGYDYYGQLGDNGYGMRSVPVEVQWCN